MRREISHPIPGKLYKIIAIVITLCLLEGCRNEPEKPKDTAKSSSTAITVALSQSESLFAQRADIEKLREAVTILGRVRNPDERNFEVEWKFAKYNYFLGKLEEDQARATESFEKGRDAGRIAAKIRDDRPDGHFWFAANLGELAKMSPLTVGLTSVDDIRESLEKVIATDPGYQGASAFDALGQLEMGTRNFKGGKTEKAVEFYEKGISLEPDNSNIHLHLAEALLALKRDFEAKKELDMLIAMKPNQEFAVEHAAVVAKAKELLARNF